jgi:hypothetical protein
MKCGKSAADRGAKVFGSRAIQRDREKEAFLAKLRAQGTSPHFPGLRV